VRPRFARRGPPRPAPRRHLLHDIGKGWPGDHSGGRRGRRRAIWALGWASTPADVDILVTLVRHHLLLPDTATRRDLEDPATAEFVASVVSDPMVLDLLAAVAEADGRATGPTAWSPWKAGLIADLVRRVKAVLAGTTPAREQTKQLSPEQLMLMNRGGDQLVVTVEPDHHGALVIATGPDQVGLMSAVTGAVALHRLDVRRASAAVSSAPDRRALIELSVQPRHGDALPPAGRLTADVAAALSGEGRPLSERLAERDRAYPSRRRGLPPAPPEVRFEDRSTDSTVVEVRALDGPGVLHRVVEALVGAGLDIRTAIVSTIGADVVDSFYVRTPDGRLPDGAPRDELRDAVLKALAEPVPVSN
jgi:[protein-PII] uridylyltransferase